jgi:hypothetical protein
MDLELLFSRNPFVQEDTARFASVLPNGTQTLARTSDGEHVVALPVEFRNQNVLVEVTGSGVTRAEAHYANDMEVQIIEQFGQVRVTRTRDGQVLPQVYVKVFARMQDGTVRFYKDGYTDLRGRFDYATLSTNELENVDRFSLLIMSETDGAAVRQAAPPKM